MVLAGKSAEWFSAVTNMKTNGEFDFSRDLEGLRAAGGESIRVAVGGTIPQQDVPSLRAVGVWEVFPMGTPLPAIVKAFETLQRGD